ncbi:uncharacterized protein LAJ45_07259 [Morchella importuna]|uniref:uncharacterized protein n=1 Tax=Morchella importuna TaxID=1174673 RepID=UPI001E8D2AA7|nr:uncharacterized protein LAJ45_07259 [Morchella importuna]KAH8148548.1 hypothetical protein LAJ45_07259 [Morchella importuna]
MHAYAEGEEKEKKKKAVTGKQGVAAAAERDTSTVALACTGLHFLVVWLDLDCECMICELRTEDSSHNQIWKAVTYWTGLLGCFPAVPVVPVPVPVCTDRLSDRSAEK